MFNNTEANEVSMARRHFNIAGAVLAVGLAVSTVGYGVYSLWERGEQTREMTIQHCADNPSKWYCPR